MSKKENNFDIKNLFEDLTAENGNFKRPPKVEQAIQDFINSNDYSSIKLETPESIKNELEKIRDNINSRINSDFQRYDIKNIKILFQYKYNEEWVNNQINYIYLWIQKILDENKFEALEKELILNIREFNYLIEFINRRSGCHIHNISDCSAIKPTHVHNMDCFNEVKKIFRVGKISPNLSLVDYRVASSPMVIRHAIELKIKSMININKIVRRKNSNKEKIIPISRYLDILKEEDLFDFPVDIEVLKTINTWSNSFVHTGKILFLWQIYWALEILEPLFSFKDNNDNYNLGGFSFLKCGIEKNDVWKKNLEIIDKDNQLEIIPFNK